MRAIFYLTLTAAVFAVALIPAVSHAQDNFPVYGNVRVAPQPSNPSGGNYVSNSPGDAYRSYYASLNSNYGSVTPNTAFNSVYTPGFNSLSVASNGAVHSYYTPGHPSISNDRGPVYFKPAFHSYYQAPGSLHYYVGTYAPLNRTYDNRR
jgi:hypothetical protein